MTAPDEFAPPTPDEIARMAEVPVDLEGLRRVAEVATPGPWRVSGSAVVSDHPAPGIGGSDDTAYYGGHLIGESINPANAVFIAAARSAVPALLSALAAEKEASRRLGEVLKNAATWHDAEAKALSKQPPGGDRDWRWCQHREQAEAIRAAFRTTLLTPGAADDDR